MLSFDSLDKILREALESDLLADAHRVNPGVLEEQWAKRWGIVSALEGDTQILDQPVRLRIGFDAYFPLSLPRLFLVPSDALGFLPHVDHDGYVCYAQTEGLVLNRSDPIGVMEEALRRAIKVLWDGSSGLNYKDFIDEFESYWLRLQGAEYISSFIRPDEGVRKISIAISGKGYEFVCDGPRAVSDYLNGRSPKQYTHRSGLYIPLRADFLITPPPPGSIMWSTEEVRRIVATGLEPENERALKRLSRKWKSEELVVFRLTRPSGGAVLFGIRFEGITDGHPLAEKGKVRRLVPVAFSRHDREFLVPRGGGNMELENKRVALIGCGSVGGYVAFEIARSGISNITLVDHEKLSEENTFRHVLGKSALGELKVEALKKDIEQKIPYVKVTPMANRIEEVLSEKSLNLSCFDLLIVALGDPTIELYLNERLYETKGSPPVIFTWLEPYGIGGHAFLANNNQAEERKPGCLECLYSPVDDDADSNLYNRASFAKEGQSFGKDLSGCGSLFTPYGSLDAMRTAELATRLGLEVLVGSVEGNPTLSWKGSRREFEKAGFLISNRYELSEDKLWARRYAYVNAKCPVCGNTALRDS